MIAPKALQLIVIAWLLGYAAPLAAQVENEQKVKTAIVYKILRFVSWPEASDETGDIIVCIAKSDPFRAAFEEIRGRVITNRKISILDPNLQSANKACSVEFTSLSERVHDVLQTSRDTAPPVLTISDSDQFAERGGMINLVIRNKRVAFKVNVDAVERTGIRISSSLLRLADIVSSETTDPSKGAQQR